MNVVEAKLARMTGPDPATHTIFSTGGYRSSDKDKIAYEGHLSPLALDLLGRYMHKHGFLKDGSIMASDNWQLGFDDASFVKSGMRHWMAVWRLMRGWPAEESLEDALGGVLFNLNGLAHQFEKRRIEMNKTRVRRFA
jgi:hypothetical protein